MALILVADDDDMLCNLVETTLQNEGHEVVLAGDGKKAVSLMRDMAFDAVIMDYDMPVMSGLDAVRQARAETASLPPVVMLTAKGDAETVHNCVAAGARDFIVKPFETSDIVRRLNTHLREGE